jgi:CHAD domain-containing protein
VKGALEQEVKLAAGGLRFDALGGEPLDCRIFTSTYYDTPDYRLARLGITLRHRREGEFAAWQLKLPRTGGRMELELEAPAELPSMPADVLDLLVAPLLGRSLGPIATLRTERRGVLLAVDGSEAEVTLDRVAVVDGAGAGTSFAELEAELQGDGDLVAVEAALREAGAVDGDGRPKLLRVLGLEVVGPQPATDAPGEHLRAMLERQYEEMLRYDPGTRLGDDPEDLHQFRVASRRLRALLRAGGPLLVEAWSEPLRAELAWLGGALGQVRDLDVLLEHLRAEADRLGPDSSAAAPLTGVLQEERDRAFEGLLAVLVDRRYFELLSTLESAARTPALSTEQEPVAAIAAGEFTRLRRAMKKVTPNSSDEELHRARIKGKRARYAAELAERAVGKRASRFIARAKRFQDVLGEHQDAVVAEERLRALATADFPADTALAAGRLVERQLERQAEARAALPKAWRKLEQAGQKAFA